MTHPPTDDIWDTLVKAGGDTHPAWRNLPTTHWVMNLEWYKKIRRASLPPDADAKTRDETKWEPQDDDMVLGWKITVTEDGGQPHLVDGSTTARFPGTTPLGTPAPPPSIPYGRAERM